MSNTKWRKLFAAMHSLPEQLGDVAVKFINNDNFYTEVIPGPEFEYNDNFGECGGISYAQFSHMEFVQIPNTFKRALDGTCYPSTEFKNNIQGLIERLNEIGCFPIQTYENGIQILGYEWSASDSSS
ncbi:MAG: DUF6678 family protein [Pirellulales bacterium]